MHKQETKMKAHFVSDLHLEFSDLKLTGGELLILAGDILIADVFRPIRTDKMAEKLRYRFNRFYNTECSKYDRVLCILGNHEHYHGVYDHSADLIRQNLPKNAQLLDDDTVVIGDVTIFGGTLWTDMNDGDYYTLMTVGNGMNDFRIVDKIDASGNLRTFRPRDAMESHKVTLEKLSKAYDEHATERFVVVTHHAPTPLSVDPRYKGSHRENGGYFSNLGEFILSRPKISTWVHGHMHLPVDYTVGNCRVISNPRGYHPHEETSLSFDSSRVLEL